MSKLEESGFFDKVYQVTCLIPYGRVTSYGAIAKYLGSARSARMVGWALNGSKNQLEDIPAHRVVNRNGVLTGKFHFGQENLMHDLLLSEGLILKENQIINFKEVFWDPSIELDL